MAITLKDAVIITDNNVIEHLKKGNECAFRFIFDKYYDYLCLIADSYLRDSFISETIVGEIIYNLWEIKESVDIKYSLRSYLVRSVKNRCINYLQQEYVQREVSINQYEDNAFVKIYETEIINYIESKINDAIKSKKINNCDSHLVAFILYKVYVAILFEYDRDINHDIVINDITSIIENRLCCKGDNDEK